MIIHVESIDNPLKDWPSFKLRLEWRERRIKSTIGEGLLSKFQVFLYRRRASIFVSVPRNYKIAYINISQPISRVRKNIDQYNL